jgi:hypothetical protein
VRSLVARALGLVDKQETTSTVTTVKEIFKIGEQEFEM